MSGWRRCIATTDLRALLLALALALALTAPAAAQPVPPPQPLSLAPGFAPVGPLDCEATAPPDPRLCAQPALRDLAQRVIAATNARGETLQDGMRRFELREAHRALWARLAACGGDACLREGLEARLAALR
jgi:uncharacterized protein